MVTTRDTTNGRTSEITPRSTDRMTKSKNKTSWIIALLLAVLAILTLNFGAACAWLVSCGVSSLVATIIMTAIIVILATVLLIFVYKNPNWLSDIAEDTGSAIAKLGSGLGQATKYVLAGTSSGLAGFVPEIGPWVLGGLAIWLLLRNWNKED